MVGVGRGWRAFKVFNDHDCFKVGGGRDTQGGRLGILQPWHMKTHTEACNSAKKCRLGSQRESLVCFLSEQEDQGQSFQSVTRQIPSPVWKYSFAVSIDSCSEPIIGIYLVLIPYYLVAVSSISYVDALFPKPLVDFWVVGTRVFIINTN